MSQNTARRLAMSAAILALALGIAAPVSAQQQGRVDVLIGFDRTPGPNEQALVRTAGGAIHHSYHLVPAIAARVPERALAGLLRNARVTTIEPDGEVHALDGIQDELAYAWGVMRIGAGDVHPSNQGATVKVAIIDTGISCTHPDLFGRCGDGWDFVNNDDIPWDDNSHGTHVAGTVAAIRNGVGVVGVGPEVELYALKVLSNTGSGSFSNVIAALQWSVDNGIQVTNNSYGSGSNPGTIVRQAFDNAYAAGVLHVASAGNAGNCGGKGNSVGYPARFTSTIAVAATDDADQRACFSSTGPNVEIAAPGVSIPSTAAFFTGYLVFSGTSMASPHVAGTAALLIAAGVTEPDQIRQILADTALDLGAAGRDSQFGHGLVDAFAAVSAAGVPPADAAPSVAVEDPADGATVSGAYPVSASASDDDAVAQVAFLVDGVSIGVDTDGGNGWSVIWDTTVSANGPRNVTAIATDSVAQTASDTVSVTVDNVATSPAQDMHVGDLDGSALNYGRTWVAQATVTVHTAGDLLVANATVRGTWSTDGAEPPAQCVTNADGQCQVSSGDLRKKVPSTTFSVSEVSHGDPDLTYDPVYNHDPEGDGGGSSIVVLKP